MKLIRIEDVIVESIYIERKKGQYTIKNLLEMISIEQEQIYIHKSKKNLKGKN